MKPRIIFTIIILLLVSCGQEEFKDNHDYLLGAWREDSSNQIRPKQWHEGTRFFEFLDSSKFITHFYHKQRNRSYSSDNQGYFITDSTFTFDSSGIPSAPPYWELYSFEKFGVNRFRIIAQFPTSWSFPHQDSILYFSRVDDLQKELLDLEENGQTASVSCETIDTSNLNGFWKLDSTVKTTSTWNEEYLYFYFAHSGKVILFWLGDNPKSGTVDYKVKENHEISFMNHSGSIVCLDSNSLIIEEKWKNGYAATCFTKMNYDTILPDSFHTYITNASLH